MTLLEEIVSRQVPVSVTATFSRTIERIAEEMAAEILKDPIFRAEVQGMVQLAFKQTFAALNQARPHPHGEPDREVE